MILVASMQHVMLIWNGFPVRMRCPPLTHVQFNHTWKSDQTTRDRQASNSKLRAPHAVGRLFWLHLSRLVKQTTTGLWCKCILTQSQMTCFLKEGSHLGNPPKRGFFQVFFSTCRNNYLCARPNYEGSLGPLLRDTVLFDPWYHISGYQSVFFQYTGSFQALWDMQASCTQSRGPAKMGIQPKERLCESETSWRLWRGLQWCSRHRKASPEQESEVHALHAQFH